MRKRIRERPNYELPVDERVRWYKLLLYSQIIGTILMVIGFIFLLLILAHVIHF